MNKPSDIPDIYIKCVSIDDLYVLLPKKRAWCEANIVLDVGLPVLKYSFITGKFKEHFVHELDAFRIDYYKGLIEKGLIYVKREALDRDQKRHRGTEPEVLTFY